MRLAVFGASGSIGGEIVRRAVADGHDVTGFVRAASTPNQHATGMRIFEGDITDRDAVARAVAGSDAVLSAIGATSNSSHWVEALRAGMTNVVAEMHRSGVRRLVALSGAAVTVPGERKSLGDTVASRCVRLVVRNVVESKQREFEVIARSGLDWVVVRPPRVTSGPFTGRYREGSIPIGPRSTISRADLAHFMLRQVVEDRYLRQAPFVSY